MRRGKDRQDVTLLDVLIDGFEKNEVLDGHHWRDLPMPDDATARGKFDALVAEATRWKGTPRALALGPGRLALRDDLKIAQSGRGIQIRVRSPWFSDWWNEDETWGDAMDGCCELFEQA